MQLKKWLESACATKSNCDRGFYRRIGVVIQEFEILEAEIKNRFDRRIDPHRRQRSRLASQLQPRLLQMVRVQVRIAKRVDEVTRLKSRDLGNHHCEQGVGGDIERNTEEHVAAALIELARESAAGDVELEQQVAGGKFHLRDVRHIPSADDHSPRIGISLDLIDDLRNLVNRFPIGSAPGTPLGSVDRAEIALLVGPLIPNRDAVLFEVANVGLAREKPKQFVDDRFQVQLLGRDAGKTLVEREPHLIAEDADRPRSGPIGFFDPLVENVLKQVVVGFHASVLVA